jgi:hypothetical protein
MRRKSPRKDYELSDVRFQYVLNFKFLGAGVSTRHGCRIGFGTSACVLPLADFWTSSKTTDHDLQHAVSDDVDTIGHMLFVVANALLEARCAAWLP